MQITPGASQANIRSIKVDLPQRLPARSATIQHACPYKVFSSDPAACPAVSVVGSATVTTPLLGAAMRGPIYLVAHGGAGFPDIVLLLQGQDLTVDLSGELYVDEHNITSAIFRAVPDVPISRLGLTLPEGNHSILVAGRSLCKGALHMLSAITAQNGASAKPSVTVKVKGCKRAAATRQQKLEPFGLG